ncbi:MAG: hypothetical protein JO232_22005 [Verrucomicrobia bacterium]|nr:hypothetical protein [Verrucomicrobiota bacterium]
MKHAGIVLLMMTASATLAGADFVGTLNVHTATDRRKTTGRDSGQPIAVQIDFSRTQDGIYDVTVWSGNRQLDKSTRIYVRDGKAAQPGVSYQSGPITVYCPATDLQQQSPTSFQIFVQAEFENGQKGGRVLIAEAAWQLGLVEDSQPGRKIEPRQIMCTAGSNLDIHATGSFLFQNQSDSSLRATLMFGGRKYGDYNLSGHANQRVQADAWGVNPGVGWYVTTSDPSSPGAQEIEAAGPIYNTEGGSDAGFNAIPLTGLNPSPTPAPVASPSSTAQ